MELASKYNPSEVEDKWYQYWTEHKAFASRPDGREPYTVVIPPPNVTGVLHMGHVLNETIQDILVRHARMEGKNACWVPGTDHASIATEAKVVGRLAQQGIKKSDLTRDEFLKHAWAWTEEHGGIILKQLRKLGCSCDWDRTAFTMDEKRSESVIKVFCDLYDKGLIYRGLRMVNWDPHPGALTALSDEEVVYKEEHSKLFYLKYYVDEPAGSTDGEEPGALVNPAEFDPTVKQQVIHRDAAGRRYAVVATTRPETIMGDVAVCINPKDPKNTWLKGKRVIVPKVGRVVPIIEDRYVEIEFGTGCLKVTPAHDANDYMLGQKYNLETIDIFTPTAKISEAAGMYVGMDRFDCRRQIVADLDAESLVEKVEDYTNKVGYSERHPDTAIEPRLSLQWFIRMQHFADLALPPVMNDEIRFHPAKYKSTYRNWMENIKDWCISRQLWWGHRIPAYFLPRQEGVADEDRKYVVAPNIDEAVAKARQIPGYEGVTAAELAQDDAALDTWFSSWLWPISLFDGINRPGNEEINYYYPTSDLVTAPDIIFFWVARMIMAGYEYQGTMPFRNVYFTGIVRDKLGRKMSKSLGNSPDPLDLIARFGADGVRMGMMLSAPAGNDILFDEALCEQGRNFNNKIWNAFRLVQGWQVDEATEPTPAARKACEWFEAEIARTGYELQDLFGKYRLSEALMAVYKLFWDEFSSWFLELVKPAYVDGKPQPVAAETYHRTIGYFDTLLKMLHPFMPFITEELWQHIAERRDGESIMFETLPKYAAPTAEQTELLARFEHVKAVVTNVRAVRAQKKVAPKDTVTLEVVGGHASLAGYEDVVRRLAGVGDIVATDAKTGAAAGFMIGTCEYAVPLAGNINIAEELAKLEADLKYQEGFLRSVMAKLSNEKFVSGAPAAVVATERKKQADSEQKIAALREAIAALKG